MTETSAQYHTATDATTEKRGNFHQDSMQLQMYRLIERHGFATIIQELIENCDGLPDCKMEILLEQARDTAQGYE